MGVRKTEEDLTELMLLEEVGQKFHGVGAKARNVLVKASALVLVSKRFDPVLYKLGHFRANLQACTYK